MVRRGKTRYVYCKKNPKHKQRQGFHSLAGGPCLCCPVGAEISAVVDNLPQAMNFPTFMPTGLGFSKVQNTNPFAFQSRSFSSSTQRVVSDMAVNSNSVINANIDTYTKGGMGALIKSSLFPSLS